MPIQTDDHAFERWLRTPWRRLLLVAAAVLILAGTSTMLLADAMATLDREVDLQNAFLRRLLTWSLWGLLFEPLLWISALLSRLIKPIVLVLLIHAGLSVTCAFGLRELDLALTESWVPSALPGPFERGPAPGPRQERLERERPNRERPDENRRDRDRFDPERRERAMADPNFDDRMERRRRQTLKHLGRHRWAESNIIIYWFIVGLGLALRSYMNHRDQERRAATLQLQATRLEGELSTARLSQLEAQLHPHFLFNALHSVGGLIRGGHREQALSTLSALGDLLRTSLQHGSAAEVQLTDEIDLVEAYLDVERIRLGDRLEVDLDSEPAASRARIPSLLLLPLVENSIKHAIAPRPEGGKLELRATREEDELVVVLMDDGPGFPEDILAGRNSEEGIGLANTKSRAQALYGDRAIHIENRESGGARVILRIPFHE